MAGLLKRDFQLSASTQASRGELASPPSFAERHYAVAEIAAMWNLSPDKVRRLFENEPGVVVLGEEAPNRGKRRYRTLLIPESVLERVHRRLSKV